MKKILIYIFQLILTINYLYSDGINLELKEINSNINETNRQQIIDIRLTGNISVDASYGFEIKISGDAVDQGSVSLYGTTFYKYDLRGKKDQIINALFQIAIAGDDTFNKDRDFKIEVFVPKGESYQGTRILNQKQQITIIDDDMINIKLYDQALTEELQENTTILIFRSRLKKKISWDVNINYKVLDTSTATFNKDYTGLEKSGNIIFHANSYNLKLPPIIVKLDNISENQEYIDIIFSDPSNTISFSTNTVRIYINDWKSPVVSFDYTSVKIEEGDTKNIYLYLNPKNTGESSTVNISIHHGSSDSTSTVKATDNNDINPNPKSFTLTFLPGVEYQSIKIEALDDLIEEELEEFHIRIDNTSDNVEIGTIDNINIKIQDNDFKTQAKISTNFSSITEGDKICIEINVDRLKSFDYSLQYKVTFPNPQANAKASKDDFEVGTSYNGDIIIKENVNYAYACFYTKDDDISEEDEFFTYSISALPDNVNVEIPNNFKDSVIIKIKDNDDNISDEDHGHKIHPRVINSLNYSTTFKETDQNSMHQFTFYLDKPTTNDSYSLTYTLMSDSAISDEDFVQNSETIFFETNSSNATINIEIIGDNEAEYLENFIVNMTSSVLLFDNDHVRVSILDDEVGVFLDKKIFNVNEGNCDYSFNCNNATKEVSIAFVEVNTIPTTFISVDYELIERTAKKHIDFVPLQGELTFDPNNYDKQEIKMQIYTNIFEGKDRNLTLKLSNPNGLEILQSEVNITIKDDDTYPTLTFLNFIHNEIDFDRDRYSQISFSHPATLDFNISYYYTDGSAINGEDYNGTNGTINVYKGDMTSQISYKILGDLIEERPKIENFNITFNNGDYFHFNKDDNNEDDNNVSINSIKIEIQDDDYIPEIIDFKKKIAETDYSRKKIFKINFSTINKNKDFEIQYKLISKTAIENQDFIKDYNGTYGTITIKKFDTYFEIPIQIVADRVDEPEEYFDLVIYNLDTNKIKKSKDDNATLVTIPIYITDDSDPIPLTCSTDLYLSSSFDYDRDRDSNYKMYIYSINIKNNIFNFVKLNHKDGIDDLYNALGYNTIDDFMYGVYQKDIYRIGSDKIKKVGRIDELSGRQYYAGVFDTNGTMYIGGTNIDTDKIYAIDVIKGKIIKTITLNKKIGMFDYGLKNNKELYVVPPGSFLHKIDLATGLVTERKGEYNYEDVENYSFDVFYSDVEGKMYAIDSNGNGFYQILTNGTFVFISNSKQSTTNDGANCPTEIINIFKDRSDAPASYGDIEHIINAELKIGKFIDHEYNSVISSNALGDDITGKDDEDGIKENLSLRFPAKIFETDINITNLTNRQAYLIGWIDFNNNGIFEISEKSETTNISKNSGTSIHNLLWDLKQISLMEVNTFMRLRLSTDLNSLETNSSKDGEVEDHQIKILRKDYFNIERSDSNFSIDPKHRKLLYTQLVYKPFSYSLVSYDQTLSTEKEIDIKTVVKVDILDKNKNNFIIATDFLYLSSINSRFTSDIQARYATKNAQFRFSFVKNIFGGIKNIDCPQNDFQHCYNKAISEESEQNKNSIDDTNNSIKIGYSKDNFAIRPHNFLIDLQNKASTQALIAEKSYTFDAKAIYYDNNNNTIITKNFTDVDAKVLLELNNDSNCINKKIQYDNILHFREGKANNTSFNSDDVGDYNLTIINNKWTEIDQNNSSLGCILESSNNTLVDGKYGCNISTSDIMSLSFYPYSLDIQLGTITNNINSSIKTSIEHIYMDNLIDFDSSGVLIKGSIKTLGHNRGELTNFTNGCAANNIKLKLNFDFILNGLNNTPKTIYGTLLDSTILIATENNSTSRLSNLQNYFMIYKDDFLDKDQGESKFKILVNIEKNKSEETNPIIINFSNLSGEYNTSIANAHIAKGSMIINEKIAFLYTTILPDNIKYPPLYFNPSLINNKKSILVDLTVTSFCNNISFCNLNTDLNITNHISSGGNWYRLFSFINHSSSIELESSTRISFSQTKNPTFTQGRSEFYVEYTGIKLLTELITLKYSPWFLYDNNEFEVSFKPTSDILFKGLGELGSILEDNNLNTTPNKIN